MDDLRFKHGDTLVNLNGTRNSFIGFGEFIISYACKRTMEIFNRFYYLRNSPRTSHRRNCGFQFARGPEPSAADPRGDAIRESPLLANYWRISFTYIYSFRHLLTYYEILYRFFFLIIIVIQSTIRLR